MMTGAMTMGATPTLVPVANATAADLEANRNGRLSESQQKRVRTLLENNMEQEMRVQLGVVLAIVAFVAGGAVMMFVGIAMDNPVMTFLGLMGILAGAIGLVVSNDRLGPVYARLRSNKPSTVLPRVRAVAGEAFIEAAPLGNTTEMEYRVVLDGVTFIVDASDFRQFEYGERYRVYFIDRPRQMLSAEKLS